MIRQFRSKQFITFLITGGIAAFANFGSRIVYNFWVDFSSAVVMAYMTGMMTAFVLAKIFVFKTSQLALHHSAFYFFLVNIVALAQTWLISVSLAYYVFSNEIAHAVGVIIPVFTSYLGHKHFSFRESLKVNRDECKS